MVGGSTEAIFGACIIMPLVVIAGQPASGKSGVCTALQGIFRERGHQAIVIDEPSLVGSRDQAYKGDLMVNKQHDCFVALFTLM